MPRIYTFFIIFIIVFSFSGCTKYLNEPDIIIDFDEHQKFEVGTPFYINYTAKGKNTDSVSFYVGNEYISSSLDVKGQIEFFPEKSGTHQFDIVLHSWGEMVTTKSFKKRFNSFNQPKIQFEITNTNGDEKYYIGEQLLIRPVLKTNSYDISDCKEMSLYFNYGGLGTQTEMPYEYVTPEVTETDNRIGIHYIDSEGGRRSYVYEFRISTNTEPTLRFEHGIAFKENVIHTIKDVVTFDLSTTDNIMVEKVEVIVNDELYETIPINVSWYNGEYDLYVPDAGEYEIYTICYAAREQIVESEKIYLTKQYSIEHDETSGFVGGVTSVEGERIYVASRNKLHIINYHNQEVEAGIEFEHTVSDIDYDKDNKKIYVSHNDGYVSIISENSLLVELIDIPYVDKIYQIAVDNKSRILMDPGDYLRSYDMVNDISMLHSIYLRSNKNMYYDNINDMFFFDDGQNNNKYYYAKLMDNKLDIIAETEIGYYSRPVIINPSNNEFIIDENTTDVYRLNPFGEYKTKVNQTYQSRYSFNYDYSELFRFEIYKGMQIIDAFNYSIKYHFYMDGRIGYDESLFIPTHESDKWLIVTEKYGEPGRFIFFEK
jgi:hypothetical protein